MTFKQYKELREVLTEREYHHRHIRDFRASLAELGGLIYIEYFVGEHTLNIITYNSYEEALAETIMHNAWDRERES